MYYKTLEVKPSATVAEIRASYRRLALATHPDKNGGAEARFLAVQKAYEVLSDATQRADYDAARLRAREKLRGFVRPPPLPAVHKPVMYKLADDVHYTFETAPHVVQCGVEYGDIISFNDVLGCFVGLAGDDWLYWCRSGQSHASRLCQRGSSFALSAVTVLQRACLGIGRPSRLPYYLGGRARGEAGGRSGGAGASVHSGMTTAERMKQELRRREKLRLLREYLDETVTKEAEERGGLVAAMEADYEDLVVYLAQTTRTLQQEAEASAQVAAKEVKESTQPASQEGSTRLPSRCPTASSSPSPPAELPVEDRAMSDCRVSPAEGVCTTASTPPDTGSVTALPANRATTTDVPHTVAAPRGADNNNNSSSSSNAMPQSGVNDVPQHTVTSRSWHDAGDDAESKAYSEDNEEDTGDCFCVHENYDATLHGLRTEEELPSLNSLHDESLCLPVDQNSGAMSNAQGEADGANNTPSVEPLLPAYLPPIHPLSYLRRAAATNGLDDEADKTPRHTVNTQQPASLEANEHSATAMEAAEDALDVSVSTSSSVGGCHAEGHAKPPSPPPQAAVSPTWNDAAADVHVVRPRTTLEVAAHNGLPVVTPSSPHFQTSRRDDMGRTKAAPPHTARSSAAPTPTIGGRPTPRTRAVRRGAKPPTPAAVAEMPSPRPPMTESERREAARAARVARATWGRQSADELFAEELAFMKSFARTQYKVGR